ncbi:murein L,D-transpeptidase [Mesorhizobium sp. YR577]|jgi:murein L,D-transpeptidase YcbB/YkuD|uniref:L,D-transpeptidase family protein n=1 Tax=Mesorhizobium sp. YR577 TaxID=1884373 RepID=UPI0008EA8290|nr:murein L,D-transpeptidase [Mesorhizobium sp. YR577]SFT79397.1 Murein L,D-transpeptidase YcbB/YkuD [Mesorhizobium sp. YR577]
MNFSLKRTVALPITVLAASLAFGAPADAQGLFDALFGGGRVQRMQREEFPPPPHAERRVPKPKRTATGTPAAVAKITGPTYYTYKADPLVRVDLGALSKITQPVSFEPSLGGTSFREGLAGLDGFDLSAEKDVAKALTDYYAANPDYIWVSGATANARAQDAVRVLGEAPTHGLDAADYAVTVPATGYSLDDMAARQRELMRFEMTLSARVLRYVRDAQNGRVDPNRISGYHDFPAKPLDMVNVLKTLAHTSEVRPYMESWHPQNAEYQALRVELESLEASSENDIVVDPKLFLRPGQSSPELPKLLQLIARDYPDDIGQYSEVLGRLGASEAYVDELVPVIKMAQEKVGLKPDGVIGPRTVGELAGTSKADRIDKVLFALEQMRWLPSDLGSPRVFINQPAFTASYIDGDTEKLKMRVVIGRPTNQTSFFYDEIEQVDYNPYWGVPQSIIVNEMLPRLRRDPGYLDRSGYEVTDSKGRKIPSSSINWGQYGAKIPYSVRQTPSEANALGELKILFPNKHAIYMHDTPQKSLFDRDSRAFSHGCVRLKDPRGMAAAVLDTTVDHIAQKLKQGHSSERVTRKIPVYVAYFTAWPEMNGKVEYFGDVYDRDAHLKMALEKAEAVRTPPSIRQVSQADSEF